MKIYKSSGIILLTTILMIVILTLLVLSLMRIVLLYGKLNNQVEVKHDTLFQLETAAQRLATNINYFTKSDCTGHEKNPNQVVERLMYHHGCVFSENNQQYYYLLEDLGIFPCLQIEAGGMQQGSHHWLITLESRAPYKEILQIRVAKPEQSVQCKQTKKRNINKGIISWRYLA